MKRCVVILSIAAVAFFCSCQQADNPIGTSIPTGKFHVDTIVTTVTVKIDTVTYELTTSVALSLVYHFENTQGIVDKVSLMPTGTIGTICYINYLRPETANDFHRLHIGYGIDTDLSGIDSIKFVRQLSGVFSSKNSNGTYDFTGTFVWQDSLFVPVKR